MEGYSDFEVVGHGASATVYRATQDGYDRQVALKVLNVDISDRRAQKRFQRERALNGRLSGHPNVVTVLDSGFVDGRYPYLAMELFELGSLADLLRERGPFDVATTLHVGVRIAGALESAHQLGVLHRDVKPQNILWSRFGEPALADFGIAAILEMEHSLTAALTPVHAAPELLEGADPSERTDVYALGSTLHTMLAGTPPFAGPAGEGMLAQLLRITTSDLPVLGRADVPASLTDVLRHAMAKRPDDRIASAAALGTALREVQRELGLALTPLPVDGTSSSVLPPVTAPVVSAASAPTAPSPSTTTGELPPPPPAAAPSPHPLLTPVAASFAPPAAAPAPMVGTAVALDEHTVDVPLDGRTVTARHVAVLAPAPPVRRRWVLPVVTAGAVLVGAAGGGVAWKLTRDEGGTVAVDTTVAATTTTLAASTTAATLPADLRTLRPTDVKRVPDTGAVVLTWTDHTGGQAPYLVYTYPESLAVAPQSPEPGKNSIVVKGVAPTADACFIVAAVVDIGPPARTANSEPVCIGNATPKT